MKRFEPDTERPEEAIDAADDNEPNPLLEF